MLRQTFLLDKFLPHQLVAKLTKFYPLTNFCGTSWLYTNTSCTAP